MKKIAAYICKICSYGWVHVGDNPRCPTCGDKGEVITDES